MSKKKSTQIILVIFISLSLILSGNVLASTSAFAVEGDGHHQQNSGDNSHSETGNSGDNSHSETGNSGDNSHSETGNSGDNSHSETVDNGGGSPSGGGSPGGGSAGGSSSGGGSGGEMDTKANPNCAEIQSSQESDKGGGGGCGGCPRGGGGFTTQGCAGGSGGSGGGGGGGGPGGGSGAGGGLGGGTLVLDFVAPSATGGNNNPTSTSPTSTSPTSTSPTSTIPATTTSVPSLANDGRPTILNLTAFTNGSQQIDIKLQGSNPDLKYFIVSGPLHGHVGKIVGTLIVYTPGEDFKKGIDSFTYKAINSAGLSSNIGTVTIKFP
jgi:hypothetical protein